MNYGKIIQRCCLGLLILILFSQTVQVQWLLRQLIGEHVQYEKAETSSSLLAAAKPSDSDIEAAENVRKALTDTERVAQRKEKEAKEVTDVFLELNKIYDSFDLNAHQKPQEDEQTNAVPPEFDESTPQVVVETRLLFGVPSIIAPEGFTAEQGWRLFPSAQDQKEPVRQRLADLTPEDSPPLAAGVFYCIEHHTPGLFRFLDDSQFSVILGECQSNSRNNLLQAPKVTMFSGQPGTINNMSEQFFGGSNSVINSEANAYSDRISQGLFLDMLPIVLDDDSVQMERFTLQFRGVIDQKIFAFVHGEELPAVVFPKIESRIFHLPVTIPKGKTLLVVIPLEIRNEEDGSPDYFGLPPLQREIKEKSVFCLAINARVLP